MIFDRMDRLAQYKGISTNLDTLIDFILTHDADSLQPGRNEIDGDNCWVMSNVATLLDKPTKYERHFEHLDLQIPLEEGEIITVKPVEDLEWPDTSKETVFTNGEPGIPLDLVPGTFAIFFPGDAHNCSIRKADQEKVRKLVGKAKF